MNRIAPIHDEDTTFDIHKPMVNVSRPIDNEQRVCKICLEEENTREPVPFTAGGESFN